MGGSYVRIRPLCGECRHFRPDPRREETILWGVCEATGRVRERCDWSDACPCYAYDRARFRRSPRGQGVGWAGIRPCYGRGVRCVTTGEVWPSVRAAAEALGVTRQQLQNAMRGAGPCRGPLKGMAFRMIREEG